MGRGSADQRDAASQERATADANVVAAQQERAAGRAQLMPSISALQNSEGYSDAEKGAQTGSAMEAIDANADSAQDQMQNQVAHTRNDAGGFGNMLQLAQTRGMQKADTARDLTTKFADEKAKRRLQGTQLMASTYGIDTNLLGNISGLPIGAVNAGNGAISKGVSLGPLGTFG